MKRKFRYLDFTWMYDPQCVDRAIPLVVGGMLFVVAICGALVWWVVG